VRGISNLNVFLNFFQSHKKKFIVVVVVLFSSPLVSSLLISTIVVVFWFVFVDDVVHLVVDHIYHVYVMTKVNWDRNEDVMMMMMKLVVRQMVDQWWSRRRNYWYQSILTQFVVLFVTSDSESSHSNINLSIIKKNARKLKNYK